MSTKIDEKKLDGLGIGPPTAEDVFAAVGTMAYALKKPHDGWVEFRAGDRPYTILISALQWERYLELCKRWQESPKDEAGAPMRPRRISLEDLACIHNALERELGELGTMVTAAATTIDQVDAEDALALVLRRLQQARKALTDLRGVEITTGKEATDAL